MSEKQLPSVQELFRESWNTLKTTASSLFKLTLLSYLAMFILVMVAFISAMFMGFFSVLSAASSTAESVALTLAAVLPFIVIGGITCVLFMALTMAMAAAQILVADAKGSGSVTQHLKHGFSYVIPMLVLSVLTSFLIFGGFFVFVFPAFIFAFFLSLVGYEVILNKQSPLGALQRSYSIVMENFFEVLVRWAAIVGVYMLVVFIIPNLLMKISTELVFVVIIASFFVNILLNWFMVVYLTTMYKHLQKHATDLKNRSMVWMWIVAVIGWVIAFLVMTTVWNLVNSPAFINAITSAFTKESVKNMKELSVTPGMYDMQETDAIATTAPATQQQQTAPVANCTRYPIREGEFTSDKCYGAKDYEDLLYYLNRYNSAVSRYNGAIASMNITCNGSEFFKASCERDQKEKTDSENDLNNYKGIIHAIIARGK